ncbi:hypothetical protein N7488_004621 [Penicillium malachiteum]|nr:hypothetical protein N7488_004621 [Penicillium malachiteum]
MPVTTRLALKRASSVKAKTIKKHVSKKKTPHVNNMVQRTKTENISPAATPPGFLQWITLQDPPSGAIPNIDELFQFSKRLKNSVNVFVSPEAVRKSQGRLSGCLLIIDTEWRSHTDMERFLISEFSLRFNKALSSLGCLLSQEVAPPLDATGRYIIQNHSINLRNHMYEVLTLYFPEDLHPKSISSIEKFEGLRSFGIEPEFLHETTLAGLVTNFPVMWKEGTCEY